MKATLFEKLEDKAVKCLTCNHYCKISEGKTGICGIRKNKDGELHLLTYGKPLGLQVDPIEKKPLHHFLPGTESLSLGTFGCNFSCEFCQNWDSSQRSKMMEDHSVEKSLENIRYQSPESIVEITKGKIPSISLTYTEPSVFFEYGFDIAKLAHKNNIKIVYVSNGFMSEELLEKMNGLLDGINVDLKSFSEDFYRKTCKGNLKPVLENIRKIHEMGIWIEITTLVIPGKNDSEKELTQIAEYIAGVDKSIPWHLSAFRPEFRMMEIPRTPMETLMKAKEIGKKAGLKYTYLGNVRSDQNTYCPSCKNIIIERDYPVFAKSLLDNGKCNNCGEMIKGVWK